MPKLDFAPRCYEQALAIDRAVYGDQHPNVASSMNNLGSAYFALGEKQKAKKYFEESLATKKRFFNEDHRSVKRTLAWLAACE